jgi:hypothetical protein
MSVTVMSATESILKTPLVVLFTAFDRQSISFIEQLDDFRSIKFFKNAGSAERSALVD